MYSWSRYRSDIASAFKPVSKSAMVFWKLLWKHGPFKSFGKCLEMSFRLYLFFAQFVFYSVRKLINY